MDQALVAAILEPKSPEYKREWEPVGSISTRGEPLGLKYPNTVLNPSEGSNEDEEVEEEVDAEKKSENSAKIACG